MVEGIQAGIEEMNKQAEELCKELHLPLIGRTHIKPGSLALVNLTLFSVNRLKAAFVWKCDGLFFCIFIQALCNCLNFTLVAKMH